MWGRIDSTVSETGECVDDKENDEAHPKTTAPIKGDMTTVKTACD